MAKILEVTSVYPRIGISPPTQVWSLKHADTTFMGEYHTPPDSEVPNWVGEEDKKTGDVTDYKWRGNYIFGGG